MWVARLRGFYVALSVSEVTARQLLLRPIRLDPMVESAVVRAGSGE